MTTDDLSTLAAQIQAQLRAGKFPTAEVVAVEGKVQIRYSEWPQSKTYILSQGQARKYLEWLESGNCDYVWMVRKEEARG